MSKEENSNEDYHYGLIHSYIFCDFLYSLSFRNRIGMDSGIIHYNINDYSIELDTLSNKELEDKYHSINKPWWNFIYEKSIQKCKVLLLIIYILSAWVPEKSHISEKKSKKKEDGDFWTNLYNEYYDTYKAIENGCQKETITNYSAKTIFCNLPVSKSSYPNFINKVLDDSHKLLYTYCIEKGIIKSNISYEDFYNGKGFFNDPRLISEILKRKQ